MARGRLEVEAVSPVAKQEDLLSYQSVDGVLSLQIAQKPLPGITQNLCPVSCETPSLRRPVNIYTRTITGFSTLRSTCRPRFPPAVISARQSAATTVGRWQPSSSLLEEHFSAAHVSVYFWRGQRSCAVVSFHPYNFLFESMKRRGQGLRQGFGRFGTFPDRCGLHLCESTWAFFAVRDRTCLGNSVGKRPLPLRSLLLRSRSTSWDEV